MLPVDWDEIRARTLALYARRGQEATDVLAPPLTEAEVREAERQFGISFPDDYRQYLTKVTAGGRVRQLRRDESGWHWAGDYDTDPARLQAPFPDHDTALAALEDLWSQQPQEKDYASPDTFQAAHEAWRDAADAADGARTAGTVLLCEHGCGFYTLLVVSGPMRGTMWFDGRATCDRLNPLLSDSGEPATFVEWYVDWLRHEEPLTTSEERRAAHERWRRGVDNPIWHRWFD